MTIAFSGAVPDVPHDAAPGLEGDDNAFLLMTLDASSGNVTRATAAGHRVVGVSSAGAVKNAGKTTINVRHYGLVTVRSHAAFAIGDSLVAAAGGKAARKSSAAVNDRLIAKEAATGADQTVLAVLC